MSHGANGQFNVMNVLGMDDEAENVGEMPDIVVADLDIGVSSA